LMSVQTESVVLTSPQSSGGSQLLITEDPGLTTVLNVSLEPRFSQSAQGGYWDGYENHQATSKQLMEPTFAAWYVPSITGPNLIGPSDCSGGDGYCVMTIWSGLTNSPRAEGGGLAQAGTSLILSCSGTSCTKTYKNWFEFLPNQTSSTFISNYTVSRRISWTN
jgi:hypothetical protein